MIKKIVIIGAGNSGLATAIGLKNSGFAVQIFEQAHCFSSIGGDIGLWPNGLRILDKLGLYTAIREHSGQYPEISVWTELGRLITTIPMSVYQRIAPYDPINICRYKLQNIL